MLKFFRTIRQSMIKENSVSKYLLYAIGEIVLVVIGILIALQLNTMKAESVKRAQEQTHLINLKEDLQFQVQIIEMQMRHDSNLVQQTDSAFLYFTGEISLEQLESMFYGAYELGSRRTFVESDAAFSELLNSGGIRIIQDIELRKAIMQYYQRLHYVSKVLNKNNNLIDAVYSLHSTNSAVMFSLDEQGQLDTNFTFTGKERYRLKQQLKMRKELSEIGLVTCSDLYEETIELMNQVSSKIED